MVKPVSQRGPREAAWIAHNRALVDKLSGGKVGYVYMSDMDQLGLQHLVRQFYARRLDKQALIMDDRWNGGGFACALCGRSACAGRWCERDVNREGRLRHRSRTNSVNGP